jgi:hypothetical protein
VKQSDVALVASPESGDMGSFATGVVSFQDHDMSMAIAELAKSINKGLHAGFDKLYLRLNSIARRNYNKNCFIINAGVRDGKDVIRALVVASGVIPPNDILPPDYPYIPPNFPQNLEALMALTGDVLDASLVLFSASQSSRQPGFSLAKLFGRAFMVI